MHQEFLIGQHSVELFFHEGSPASTGNIWEIEIEPAMVSAALPEVLSGSTSTCLARWRRHRRRGVISNSNAEAVISGPLRLGKR